MKTSKVKYIVLIIGLFTLFFSTIYNHKENNNISYNKNVIYEGAFSIPENLNQLQQNSQIIVSGIYTGTRTTDSDKTVIGPSSISQFEVQEVYKGDIQKGIISLVEPCEFRDESYYNVDGYMPIKKDNTYMLYLKQINTTQGPQYTIVSGNFGKYNLTNKSTISPYTSTINDFDQISYLDMITASVEKCSIYNKIKSEITNETCEESNTEPKLLTKEEAYYNFRIKPSNNVTYYIDTQNTNQYPNHIQAYQNAIQKIQQSPHTNISFSQSNTNTNTIIDLTSVNSPKEQWLGIARINYIKDTPYNTVSKTTIYLNEYNIQSYKLTKEHLYEVALHEICHTFGLLHQDYAYASQTIMGPYLSTRNKARIDLTTLDKNNLTYAYPISNDWQKHWANTQITNFMELGYIKGYSNGVFLPDNPITRAEFVTVLNKVFGLTDKSQRVFEDTQGHWAKDEIDIAVTNKVANGVSEKYFDPDAYITREQAAKMISNYKVLESSTNDNIKYYKDYKNISTWAVGAVDGVIQARYMNGYEDMTFRPQNNITRAEAVVTMSRIK